MHRDVRIVRPPDPAARAGPSSVEHPRGVQPGQTVYVGGQPVTANALTPSAQSSPSPLSIQDGVTVAAVPVPSGTHAIATGD